MELAMLRSRPRVRAAMVGLSSGLKISSTNAYAPRIPYITEGTPARLLMFT